MPCCKARRCTGAARACELARADPCSAARMNAASSRARRWLLSMPCRARAPPCSPTMTAISSARGMVVGGRGCTTLQARASRPSLVDEEQHDETAGTTMVLIAAVRAAGTSLLVDDDCRLERARARRCGDLHGRSRGARSQQGNRWLAGGAHGASRDRAGSTPLSRTSCLINARRLAGARRHFGRQPCGALRGQLPARALHRARRARNPCHSSEAANVEHGRQPRLVADDDATKPSE